MDASPGHMIPALLVPYLKVTLAAALGVVIGAERSWVGKDAGMRTYGFVAMGSAFLIVISQEISTHYLGVLNFDPLRLAAAIVTGIGFLGAGMIFSKEGGMYGLTSAAGLWLSSAIGIAVGFDLYGLALYVTLVALVMFVGLLKIDHIIRGRKR